MVVTINTDASFNMQHKVGGYAYWIVYNGERIKKGGVLKECETSLEAEVKAIANALYKLTRLPWNDINLIIVNTDCVPAISLITCEGVSKNSGINSAIAAINSYILILKCKSKILKSNDAFIDYRHVKAHTNKRDKDKRTYVNDWCDSQSKYFVKQYIYNLCHSKNSQPGLG